MRNLPQLARTTAHRKPLQRGLRAQADSVVYASAQMRSRNGRDRVSAGAFVSISSSRPFRLPMANLHQSAASTIRSRLLRARASTSIFRHSSWPIFVRPDPTSFGGPHGDILIEEKRGHFHRGTTGTVGIADRDAKEGPTSARACAFSSSETGSVHADLPPSLHETPDTRRRR